MELKTWVKNAFPGVILAMLAAGCGICGEGKPAAKPEPEKVKTPEFSCEVTDNGVSIEKFFIDSPSMGRKIQAGVVLPPDYGKDKTRKYPVLYALHGADAPWETWSKMRQLNHAIVEKPMIVVFFNGDSRGYYVDSTVKKDSKFMTFFFNELMPYIDKKYAVDQQSRHLTGFSMGGYGSMNYMLHQPGKFKSVCVYSSGLHYFDVIGNYKPMRGTQLLGKYEDNQSEYAKYSIYGRLENYVARGGVKLPAIKLIWGDKDNVAQTDEMSQYFVKYWTARNLPLESERLPGGHNWKFWSTNSPKVVDFVWKNR